MTMIVTPELIKREAGKIEYWKDSQEDLVAELYFQVLDAIACNCCDNPQACAKAALQVNPAYETR